MQLVILKEQPAHIRQAIFGKDSIAIAEINEVMGVLLHLHHDRSDPLKDWKRLEFPWHFERIWR